MNGVWYADTHECTSKVCDTGTQRWLKLIIGEQQIHIGITESRPDYRRLLRELTQCIDTLEATPDEPTSAHD
jgi:hypothetical protein